MPVLEWAESRFGLCSLLTRDLPWSPGSPSGLHLGRLLPSPFYPGRWSASSKVHFSWVTPIVVLALPALLQPWPLERLFWGIWEQFQLALPNLRQPFLAGPGVHQLLLLETQFASHCINKGESSTVRVALKAHFIDVLLLLSTYITFLPAGDGCNKASLSNTERDPSREKTQCLIPLFQIVSYLQLSEKQFLFAGYFPGGSYLRRGDLGNRYAWLFSFQKQKTVVTIQLATKRMSMTSAARVQPAPQLGVNPTSC